MAISTNIMVKNVHSFISSREILPEKKKVFLTRLMGCGNDNQILTAAQLNMIFEGSPSLRSAFEAQLKNQVEGG